MATTSSIRRKMIARHREQGGLCYWCKRPTPIRDGRSTKQLAEFLGIEVGAPRWRQKVEARMATAEHLTPQSKGGTDRASNIVMACKGCNNHRGDTDAGDFTVEVPRSGDVG